MKAVIKLLLIGSIWARSAWAAELSFNGYFSESKQTFVSLSDSDHSTWVQVGDSFGQYRVKEFRPKTEEVLLQSEQKDLVLSLKKAVITASAKLDQVRNFFKNRNQVSAVDLLGALGPPASRAKLDMDTEAESKSGYPPAFVPDANESWWVYPMEGGGNVSVGIHESQVIAVGYLSPKDEKGKPKFESMWLPKPAS